MNINEFLDKAIRELLDRPTYKAGNYGQQQLEEASNIVRQHATEIDLSQFKTEQDAVNYFEEDMLTVLQKGSESRYPTPLEFEKFRSTLGVEVPKAFEMVKRGEDYGLERTGAVNPETAWGKAWLVKQAKETPELKVGTEKLTVPSYVSKDSGLGGLLREWGPTAVLAGGGLMNLAGGLGALGAFGSVPAAPTLLSAGAVPATPSLLSATAVPAGTTTLGATAVPSLGSATMGAVGGGGGGGAGSLTTSAVPSFAAGTTGAASAAGGLGTTTGLQGAKGMDIFGGVPGLGVFNEISETAPSLEGLGTVGGKSWTDYLLAGGALSLPSIFSGLGAGIIAGEQTEATKELQEMRDKAEMERLQATLDAQRLLQRQELMATMLQTAAQLKQAGEIAKQQRISEAFSNLMTSILQGRREERGAMTDLATLSQKPLLG